ncbi:coiled-coil domain-containing protein [Paenibacillus sp. MCAF20]
MRRIAGVIVVTLLTVFMLHPASGEAASLSQIKKQIEEAKKEMRDAERRAAEAQKQAANANSQKSDIEVKKSDAQASIQNILAEIDNVTVNKMNTQAEVDAKEEELLQTGTQLEQAEQRVVERDELLQSRMRLMYTNGFVSYMDVLLSATSFTDFIDRFDALQSILSQDHDILEEQKQEKELVVQKKAEVEKQFAEVKAMYDKLEKYENAVFPIRIAAADSVCRSRTTTGLARTLARGRIQSQARSIRIQVSTSLRRRARIFMRRRAASLLSRKPGAATASVS